MRAKKWSEDELRQAVTESLSIRRVLLKLGLKPAGGNYSQITKYLRELNIDTTHFKGRGWNKGLKGFEHPRISLDQILVSNSNFQSYKLKKRLFSTNLKNESCEECGWAKRAEDGRIPLELDHINGNSRDNRLENLRVLCPNCHSLKPTHRGLNRSKFKN